MADDLREKAKHLGGKVQEKAGELLGDRETRREGRTRQVEGEAEQRAERARDEEREAREEARTARRARGED